MVLEAHINLCVTEPGFADFFPLKIAKMIQNRPRTGFFKFVETFGQLLVLNLFYNENSYYLLCPCTNPTFGKNFVSET